MNAGDWALKRFLSLPPMQRSVSFVVGLASRHANSGDTQANAPAIFPPRAVTKPIMQRSTLDRAAAQIAVFKRIT
jgi:hypothetical protein